jgi:hypothetical protein
MRITIGKAKRGLGSLLPGQAYLGRPCPLGNPFVVGGSRQEVIAKYRRWLWARLQEPDSAQERELRRLLAQAVAGELELLCWCHPLPCHGEVVRGAVLWVAGEEEGRAHANSGRNRPEKPTIETAATIPPAHIRN